MRADEAAKVYRISGAELRVVTKMVTLLSRHILPLFVELPGGKPQLLGSGFLVSSGNDSYLISAAHVFDPVWEIEAQQNPAGAEQKQRPY
jgi:hypothetical protein